MLIIKYPNCCINEYNYILRVIFTEFLGIEFECVRSGYDMVSIVFENKQLKIPNIFFHKAENDWLGKATLPAQPLRVWDTEELLFDIILTDTKLPIIYGKGSCQINKEQAQLDIDVFGSVFFMLSRYEEAVKIDRDDFDRFPAIASLAVQETFLERPIVNEYVELLWAMMKRLWPQLKRKKRIPRTLISCDVDHPHLSGIKNMKRQVCKIGGDLLKRKDFNRAMSGLWNFSKTVVGGHLFDTNYTAFRWMLDVNEAVGNKVAFFFMSDNTDSQKDGCYSLNSPVVRRLIREIHERGHEIGLHPSYNTYCDQGQTIKEANRLRRLLDQLNISQDRLGGRQHYLRWKTSQTARNLTAAEINYDSTLTFVDRIGFRCGVCYEYPMYDLQEKKELSIWQRPLIAMEVTLFGQSYMGLNYDNKTISFVRELRNKCHKFNGDFTFLWHNSNLTNKIDKKIYKNIIKYNL